MVTAIVVMQHTTWEDDGGCHNPVIYDISTADFKQVVDMSRACPNGSPQIGEPNTYSFTLGDHVDEGDLREIFTRSTSPSKFPIQVDYVLNIWYDWH